MPVSNEISLRIATGEDVILCLAVRRQVFVEEQGIPEELDLDDRDADSTHFLLALVDVTPIGTARFHVMGAYAKIGRVAVAKEFRGRGLGTVLIKAAVAESRRIGLSGAVLHAQAHAARFYERLGFQKEGPEFEEAGKSAVRMTIAY